MLPTVKREILRISNECTDPSRAEQKMLSAMKSKEKLTRATNVRNFLQNTQARGLGTNEAMSIARNLTQSGTRSGTAQVNKGILMKIMKIKVDDANKHLEIVRKQDEKEHRCLRDILPPGSRRQRDFFKLQSSTMSSIWERE